MQHGFESHPFRRNVAQPGSASALGAEGRVFESRRSEKISITCLLLDYKRKLIIKNRGGEAEISTMT